MLLRAAGNNAAAILLAHSAPRRTSSRGRAGG
jgi:hypothetical protein